MRRRKTTTTTEGQDVTTKEKAPRKPRAIAKLSDVNLQALTEKSSATLVACLNVLHERAVRYGQTELAARTLLGHVPVSAPPPLPPEEPAVLHPAHPDL